MLEIRRWKANKAYENTFFRVFAKNLKDFFDRENKEGLLIANSFCEIDETLQIDALLITESSICLIDFKNFWWKINLPNNENNFWYSEWTNEEWVRIKGWSSINPYQQLFKQKWKFSRIVKNKIISRIIKDDYINPSHTKKIVCFQKNININGNIPKKDEIDFFIMDETNYLEVISDIINIEDKEVIISKKTFNIFKEYFKADDFKITEIYEKDKNLIFDKYNKDLNYDSLELDQKEWLTRIESFIKNKESKIFILQWTASSWKTYLIDFIKDISFNNWISNVECIVQSTRIARNLFENSSIKFDSMYSTIYWWKSIKEDIITKIIDKKEIKKILEIIPIKNNEDSEDTLYIIDESQLIWDNYNEWIDLRFWSWMLLRDFINYVDLENTNRKIVFIWDIFQLNIWKQWENSLFPSYFKEKYSIDNVENFQLNDKPNKHFLWKQIFSLTNSIRQNTFNNLSIKQNSKISLIEKNNILEIVKNKLNNNINFHILNYSNNDSKKINMWIKKNILKNWDDLNKWDLVLINNNISIINSDPFSTPQKIYNWDFWTIQEVSNNLITENIEVKKWKNVLFTFRKIKIKLQLSSEIVTIFSFENYRLSEKWELSQDEVKAFHIILSKEIKETYLKEPFEETTFYEELKNHKYFEYEKNFINKIINDWKTKAENDKQKELKKYINILKRDDRERRKRIVLTDIDSKSYLFKNSVYLRYWWALTTHKSISYQWDEILINAETGWWKTNETYFKWLYTWLTRATEKIYIINFENINIFNKVTYWEQISKIDKNIYFISDLNVDLLDEDKSISKKYNFPEDHINILLQFYKFIENKFIWKDIKIKNIIHNNYQENYELEGLKDTINFTVYYNNKWQFKTFSINKSSSEEFKRKITSLLENENKIKDFWFINDKWREEVYKKLFEQLKEKKIYFKYILQTKFKDTIKLSKMWENIIFDIYYNQEWFFSKIILKYSDNDEIFWELKNIINNYE